MIGDNLLSVEKRKTVSCELLNIFASAVVDGKLEMEILAPKVLAFLDQNGPKRVITGRNVHHILVIRLEEIGDLVLGSGFLRELRRNQPQAYITLLVKPECKNLVEWCPYVNEIHSVRTWVRGEARA